MPAILASVVLTFCAPATDGFEPQPMPSQQYRWYERSALPLVLHGGHLMVTDIDGRARELLVALGFHDVRPLAPSRSDWLVAQVPSSVCDERALIALSSRIAQAELRVSPIFVDELGGPMFLQRDAYVAFEPGLALEQSLELVARTGAFEIVERDTSGMRGVWLLRARSLDGFEQLAALNELAQAPGVRFCEPDWCSSLVHSQTPSDPLFANAWALNNTGQTTSAPTGGGTAGVDLNAPEAWDYSRGAGVIVMVMDDGAQIDHPDLNVVWGQDWTGGGSTGGPVNAWDRHGTAVAGCIAARMNALDTVGLAPEAAIATAKIAVGTGPGTNMTSTSWVIGALWAAEQLGVRVSNSSWSIGATSSAMEQKFADTRVNGMVHFAAAGNDGGGVLYPARHPALIAVGAIDWDGARAQWAGGCNNGLNGSNFGPELDLVAPGEDVLATDRTGLDGYSAFDYVCADGTSFASPYAAAAAALMISRAPQLTASDVQSILELTARDRGPAGFDNEFGWGSVDALKALQFTPGPPVVYCTGGTTTSGCVADITAIGTPSAIQPSGFTLSVGPVEGQKQGLIFYGGAGRVSAVHAPASTSMLCVKAPTQHTGAANSGGVAGTCSGAFALDWLDYLSTHPNALGVPISAGEMFNAQAWFRDPWAPGMTNLSSAIEFIVLP